MKVYKVNDYHELSKKAASILAAEVVSDPTCTLGLATGSTPEETYAIISAWFRDGFLDFSGIKTVNLDEYKGISPENPQSYYYFMREKLFKHINIREENTYIPTSEEECADYEALIARLGGIKIQLLGIGRNAHIGFNEPGDSFPKVCHCVTLAESTIEANKRFFEREEDVPKQAYTMGIGTIMRAQRILLLASGADKAEAVWKTLCGPVTPYTPASALQLHHDVIFIADKAALSKVEEERWGCGDEHARKG